MHRIKWVLLFLIIGNIGHLVGQEFSDREKLSGYALRDTKLVFIFDADIYDLQPLNVSVTGSFRSWSQDMEDEVWSLKPLQDEGSVWILEIENRDFEQVKPLAPFKYRIDNGRWLDPPISAENKKGGNLIFMHEFTAPKIKAELLKNNSLWLYAEGLDLSTDPSDYELVRWDGKKIIISSILPNTANKYLVSTSDHLDYKRVHSLKYFPENLKVDCRFDGWFRKTYSTKELGANVSEDKKETNFRIFGPRLEAVKLYLYNSYDVDAFQVIDMVEDSDGVWEAKVNRDLTGVYYDFTVHGPKEPGSHSYEVDGGHISDPYARANVEAQGRSRVMPKTKPASALKNGIPKLEDVVAYEVHVQDFTDQLPVGDNLKGTMSAMIKKGMKNERGEKVGFDYLVDLGINVLHLMPVQEYLHYPDREWKASFEDDPYMIRNGINEENYQWGYRTTHCFAVENRYREKGSDYGAEREQFRDLVQAFHDENIAVIIDIVPNHTGENMDGSHFNFHFNALDKLYYYRTKDYGHIGAFGNEVKTENRPMVQRWLIDQCKHFIEEFGIDGFRIDLAGQIDKQTLIALRKELGDDIIIYGEPWIASNDPEFEENPDWDWYKDDAPITFFQDDTRNAFKGTVFGVSSKTEDRGWPGGKYVERENVIKGLSAYFPTDKTPLSGINYLDIHDNMALADQFGTNDFDGRKGVDENLYKIAATLLFTSLGPLVLHGGSEFMRSKGFAPTKEIVKTMNNGQKLAFHGKGDTYNLRVPNQFVWENIGRTKDDEESHCDYKGMRDFWRGLIHFRNSEYGKSFRLPENPRVGYYRWILERDEKAMGYIVDDHILVLLNTADYEFIFYVNELPQGRWKLIGTNDAFDHVNGVQELNENEILYGGNLQLKLPPEGLRVWVKE